MPRRARLAVEGIPWHIIQRGNNRTACFYCADDYLRYLKDLAEQAAKYGCDIHAYCLMTNHVHLVATPRAEESLARALGRTHFRYTQYVNRLHGRSGHLWQNRFYSCALDEEHYPTAMAYVEQNPVRARMVRRPWRYRWSSAAAHCGQGPDRSDLLDLGRWQRRLGKNDWEKTLVEMLSKETLSAFRLNTHRGRPLASDRFMSKLESLVGRRLRPLPVGRPRKTK